MSEHRVLNNTVDNFAAYWEKKGRYIVFNTLLVGFFLETGSAFVFFDSDGKMPCVRQDLEIINIKRFTNGFIA